MNLFFILFFLDFLLKFAPMGPVPGCWLIRGNKASASREGWTITVNIRGQALFSTQLLENLAFLPKSASPLSMSFS